MSSSVPEARKRRHVKLFVGLTTASVLVLGIVNFGGLRERFPASARFNVTEGEFDQWLELFPRSVAARTVGVPDYSPIESNPGTWCSGSNVFDCATCSAVNNPRFTPPRSAVTASAARPACINATAWLIAM